MTAALDVRPRPTYKDDDRRDEQPAGATVNKDELAKTYRQTLLDARKEQIDLTEANLTRLLTTYDAAAESIYENIRNMPAASEITARQQYYLNLVLSLDQQIAWMMEDYAELVDAGMLELAQSAATREAKIAELVGATEDSRLSALSDRVFTLSDSTSLTVQFGSVASDAVSAISNRIYSDGLKLSSRIYSLTADTQRVIGDTLVQGIAEQLSGKELAKRLEEHIREGMTFEATASEAERVAKVRYRAITIARTEMQNAYQEAHIAGTLDPSTGKLKSYISAIGWRLSASHGSNYDRCDAYAADDGAELGPGNYLPGDVPTSHPNCFCMTLGILVALPEEQFVTMAPDPASVPESQMQYLVEKENDPVAARWLEKYGT